MLACVLAALVSRGAGAQVAEGPPDRGSPGGGVDEGRIAAGEIRLGLESFGVGGRARAGDWAGVRVKLFDTGTEHRSILLRLEGPDQDGDTVQYEREVTTNPGTWEAAWLYARLPYTFGARASWTISVYEARDGGQEAGRLINRAPLSPATGAVVEPEVGLVGVVGSDRYGLEQYYDPPPGAGARWSSLRHELTEPVVVRTPMDLPDRWMGLGAFESLVWGNGDPTQLTPTRARALREWVERGGHLIVVLPAVSQVWTSAQSNPIRSLLPVVTIRRVEDVDLSGFRGLLAYDPTAAMPGRTIVHTLEPLPDAKATDAMTILASPGGEPIVSRRLVGAGMVTLIGLDLNHAAFARGAMLDAQAFWHRVLGKRGPFVRRAPGSGPDIPNRSLVTVDADIPLMIRAQGRAGVGIVLAMGVFSLYWLVAGPGWYYLRRRGLARHGWVAFAGTAGVFTVIAWTGATLLRPKRVEVTHFTILDHVFGQNVQRARLWAGVMLPNYGEAEISVGDPSAVVGAAGGARERTWNTLTTWEGPDGDVGSSAFPDTRAYRVDCEYPDAMRVPARATVKQVVADWAGAPAWDMPHPVGDKPEIVLVPGLRVSDPDWVEGTLVHGLPSSLRDVRVILVQGQMSVPTGTSREFPLSGYALSLPEWKPGDPLDLKALGATSELNKSQLFSALEAVTAGAAPRIRDSFASAAGLAPNKFRDRVVALALFGHLAPLVEGDSSGAGAMGEPAARRLSTQTLDVSRWLSQPCVIIIGRVDGRGRTGESTAVPIRVNGREPMASGATIVRWVYPLAPRPPKFASQGDREAPVAR